ncbi:MAG: adenylate/guanylate cyclase domain-containing protein [Alphaproteobacteria bacterium]
MTADSGSDDTTRKARKAGLPIAAVLVGAISLVVIIAVGVIFIVGYGVASRNTHELVAARSALLISSVITHTRNHLAPVEAQLEYVAGLLTAGPAELTRPTALGPVLRTSLAASPQVSVLAFLYPDMTILRAFRDRDGRTVAVDDWRDDPSVRRTLEHAQRQEGLHWGELFVAERSGRTFINARQPIFRDGAFAGTLIAGVSIDELSGFVADLDDEAFGHAFILYGKNEVLAHPRLRDATFTVSDTAPLPTLADFPDPIMRALWDPEREVALPAGLARDNEVRAIEVDGETYVIQLRALDGFGDRPWLVGTYQDLGIVAVQLDRLTVIPLIAVAIIVASILLALLLSRGLSRPIRRLAGVAHLVRELELDRAPLLGRSRYRELSEAAGAYNAMIGALRAFETYVPRPLVRRLMKAGPADTLKSEERDVTILFTDIVGFTEYCEGLAPAEVAAFVNEHFALLDGCVEAEQGTVDKYIGDSLMAFWGAPEHQPDHAERACRAALCIERTIRADNRRRAAAGRAPVRLRMGIHSGPVLVGNIGAPSRVNYTVIGDTVNTAERLEGFGKTVPVADSDVVMLLSGETAARLGPAFACERLGRFLPPGRQQRVEAFRLLPRPANSPEGEACT